MCFTLLMKIDSKTMLQAVNSMAVLYFESHILSRMNPLQSSRESSEFHSHIKSCGINKRIFLQFSAHAFCKHTLSLRLST